MQRVRIINTHMPEFGRWGHVVRQWPADENIAVVKLMPTNTSPNPPIIMVNNSGLERLDG